MSKKSLIILIVAIVVVAGVAYWAGRSSNQVSPAKQGQVSTNPEQKVDTANWKTYSSKKYGFSFRYPIEGKVVENDSNIELQFNGLENWDKDLVDSERSMFITVKDLSTTNQAKLLKPYHYEDVGNYKVVVEENVFGAGQVAEAGPVRDFYLVTLKNIVLEIGIDRTDNNQKVVKAIIGTLW